MKEQTVCPENLHAETENVATNLLSLNNHAALADLIWHNFSAQQSLSIKMENFPTENRRRLTGLALNKQCVLGYRMVSLACYDRWQETSCKIVRNDCESQFVTANGFVWRELYQ